jgi:hypothetical protein
MGSTLPRGRNDMRIVTTGRNLHPAIDAAMARVSDKMSRWNTLPEEDNMDNGLPARSYRNMEISRDADRVGELMVLDAVEVFTHAIDTGYLSQERGGFGRVGYAGDFMYMFSDEGYDYFKDIEDRTYYPVPTVKGTQPPI